MKTEEIVEALKSKFGNYITEIKTDAIQPWAVVLSDKIKEVCVYLRDDVNLQFDYLSCLSGMDYTNGKYGVVYHLASTSLKHKIVLKTFCSKENMHIQSIHNVWGCANWHEREAFDMFGIIFDEHPDLRRILLPDDWEGNPLCKDYKVQEFYHGMKVTY